MAFCLACQIFHRINSFSPYDSTFQPDRLLEPRPPVQEDLVALCRTLSELGARYLIVGGFAIIHAGYPRFAMDVDLMGSASGIGYEKAAKEIVLRKIGEVEVPFASPRLLYRMKKSTHREKDAADLLFLQRREALRCSRRGRNGKHRSAE